MKAKVSLTLDDALLAFVDTQPGVTRSQKVESALRRYRDAWQDARLRAALTESSDDQDDRAEADAWRRVMQEAMWKPSAVETSGPSRSRRSPSRARRSSSR